MDDNNVLYTLNLKRRRFFHIARTWMILEDITLSPSQNVNYFVTPPYMSYMDKAVETQRKTVTCRIFRKKKILSCHLINSSEIAR